MRRRGNRSFMKQRPHIHWYSSLYPTVILRTHKVTTGIAEVIGSNPVQAWNSNYFSGFNFTTAQVVSITASMSRVFVSFFAVQISDFFMYSLVYNKMQVATSKIAETQMTRKIAWTLTCDTSAKLSLGFSPRCTKQNFILLYATILAMPQVFLQSMRCHGLLHKITSPHESVKNARKVMQNKVS